MASKLSFILFLLVFITLCHSFPNPKLRMPSLKITHVEKCSPDNEKYINLTFVLNNVDSDGWKSIDVDVDFIQSFNDYYFTLVIHKQNNGDWQKNIYAKEGKACDLYKEFLTRAIEKFKDETKPKIKDICSVEKGKHSVRNFEVPKDAIDIPSMPGMLQVIIHFFDENKENIFCLNVMAEFTA